MFSNAMPDSVSFLRSTSGSPRLVETITSVSSGMAPSSGKPSISCGHTPNRRRVLQRSAQGLGACVRARAVFRSCGVLAGPLYTRVGAYT